MADRIGPSFMSELGAAGCLPGVAFQPDGILLFQAELSSDVKARAQAVLKDHDPTKPAPPTVSGDDVIGALSAADAAKADVRDLVRLAARNIVTSGNVKLARIAKAVGRKPDDLLKAAQG